MNTCCLSFWSDNLSICFVKPETYQTIFDFFVKPIGCICSADLGFGLQFWVDRMFHNGQVAYLTCFKRKLDLANKCTLCQTKCKPKPIYVEQMYPKLPQ